MKIPPLAMALAYLRFYFSSAVNLICGAVLGVVIGAGGAGSTPIWHVVIALTIAVIAVVTIAVYAQASWGLSDNELATMRKTAAALHSSRKTHLPSESKKDLHELKVSSRNVTRMSVDALADLHVRKRKIEREIQGLRNYKVELDIFQENIDYEIKRRRR